MRIAYWGSFISFRKVLAFFLGCKGEDVVGGGCELRHSFQNDSICIRVILMSAPKAPPSASFPVGFSNFNAQFRVRGNFANCLLIIILLETK